MVGAIMGGYYKMILGVKNLKICNLTPAPYN